MTEAITKALLRQSEELIKHTDSLIAQADANKDISEPERVYVKERLTLTKLTQQSAYEFFKAGELLQKQYDLFQKLHDQLYRLGELNGEIYDQAVVIDNILTLTAATEGKSH